MLQLLIKHGADVNYVSKGKVALHKVKSRARLAPLLIENGADPNIPGKYNKRTPFHEACSEGYLEVAKELILCADPN